jgi:hypothetical protein
MTKIIGYLLLALSFLLFGLILVVPWLNFTKGTIAWMTTALFVAAEVLFYLSIFLIGKNLIVKLKNRLLFWKTKTINNPTPEQIEQK